MMARPFWIVLTSFLLTFSVCVLSVIAQQDVSEGRKLTIWTDLSEAVAPTAMEVLNKTWVPRDAVLELNRVEVIQGMLEQINIQAEGGDTDSILVIDCGVGVDALTSLANIKCFCYTSTKMTELHMCPHSIQLVESQLFLATIQQSQWRDGVIISSRDEADTMNSLANQGAGYIYENCNINTVTMRRILDNHKCQDDFFNILIDCTDVETLDIIEMINEQKPGSLNEAFRSNYLLRTSGMLYNISVIRPILQDGDNAVVLGAQDTTFTRRVLTRTLFRDTWQSSLYPSFLIERCMYDCWKTDYMMHVGVYHNAGEIVDRQDMVIPAVWQQYYGKTLIASSVDYEPFYVLPKDNNGIDGGMEVELIRALESLFNFTLKVIPVSPRSWGSYSKSKGVWTGMVGEVVYKRADFCIGGITVTSARAVGIDFLTPHFQEVNAAVINLPWTRSGFFYEVFSPLLWCAIVCLPILAAVILWLLNYFFEVPVCGDRKEKFLDDLFLCYGISMFQGSEKIATGSLAGKFIIFFHWLTVIILLATYAGNLTANLAVKKVNLPFRSLEEIKDVDEYVVGIKPGSSREDAWGNSPPGSLFHSLFLKVQRTAPRSYVDGSEDALKKMLADPKILYVADKIAINNRLKKKGLCSFVFLPVTFVPAGLGIGTKKNSPQTKHYNKQIKRMIEMGLTNYWENVYKLPDNCENLRVPQASGTPISLHDSQFLFVLLAGGMGVALAVTVVEMIIACMRMLCRKYCCKKPPQTDENGQTDMTDKSEPAEEQNGDVAYAETSH